MRFFAKKGNSCTFRQLCSIWSEFQQRSYETKIQPGQFARIENIIYFSLHFDKNGAVVRTTMCFLNYEYWHTLQLYELQCAIFKDQIDVY